MVLGQIQIDAQRFAQAERALRNVLRLYDQTGVRGWQRAATAVLLGRSLLGQRRHAAAEPALLEGYRALQAQRDEIPADEHKILADTRADLRRLYKESGTPGEGVGMEPTP